MHGYAHLSMLYLSNYAHVHAYHIHEVKNISRFQSNNFTTLSPPLIHTCAHTGGATALIAVMGSDRIHALGYWYILFPAMLGSVIHVFIAVLWNNTSGNNTRAYPKHWWPVEVSPLPPSSPSLSFSPPESFRLPLPDSNHDTKDTDTHAANHRDACAGARTHTRTQKTDTQHEHNNVNVSMDDENEDYVEMNHIQMTQ